LEDVVNKSKLKEFFMKKILSALLLIFAMLLSACGGVKYELKDGLMYDADGKEATGTFEFKTGKYNEFEYSSNYRQQLSLYKLLLQKKYDKDIKTYLYYLEEDEPKKENFLQMKRYL